MHSFAHGYPIFPTLYVEKTILSPLNAHGIPVKNHLTMYMRVYFWVLYSIPLVYMSAFMLVPHCFDYCSL